VCVSAMFGFVALGVDIGRLYTTKAELQRAADAAALAAAWELLNEDRMNFELQEGVFAATRQEAADTAAANHVHNAAPVVDLYEDVIIGRLNDFPNLDEPMSFDDPTIWNAVAVTVQRTAVRNGSIALPFGRLLGILSTELTADATAAFDDGIVGFEVSESTGNAELLPFTLKTESWADVMSSPRDEYSYDPETGEVSGGSDGIPELNIFPGGGTWQLPPGNFGTVDIGSPDNSAADVARQILHGVNAEDLSYFGGCLMIGDVGYVDLNGDTGISAGFKDELEAVKGQPRAIPLFSSVWDPGENATFRIVSFAGIRIMHVRLTGATQRKELIVQPAFVVDDSAISSESGSSYYVYRPVQLVR
jgi:Flp pilus assembly protein TadG